MNDAVHLLAEDFESISQQVVLDSEFGNCVHLVDALSVLWRAMRKMRLLILRQGFDTFDRQHSTRCGDHGRLEFELLKAD